MKKLALYSRKVQGLSDEMDKELMKMIGKSSPVIGYIPSCSSSERKYYEETFEYFKRVGVANLIYLDIDKEYDETQIGSMEELDALYLSGGNTFYFLNNLKRRDLIIKLRRYVENGGVLIGESAGSIIMCETIDVAKFGDENEIGITDISALGLVDFEILPHWGIDEIYDVNKILKYSEVTGKVYYTCKDGDGIIVDDKEVKFFGNITRIEKGKMSSI